MVARLTWNNYVIILCHVTTRLPSCVCLLVLLLKFPLLFPRLVSLNLFFNYNNQSSIHFCNHCHARLL
ncbi:hypothetical protein L873DRAFT_733589 [Choiromyces venosus 120613-1]|uniref:Uncharacterized protein n=1 Tax=Choiromyces venosus 120613-1 TaxID=1336337 RepID=A0A3N4IXS5_9PEZI|nr:hypothetical protein L873DRAFT_733589 [Choiromyces venosus 120613-1]